MAAVLIVQRSGQAVPSKTYRVLKETETALGVLDIVIGVGSVVWMIGGIVSALKNDSIEAVAETVCKEHEATTCPAGRVGETATAPGR